MFSLFSFMAPGVISALVAEATGVWTACVPLGHYRLQPGRTYGWATRALATNTERLPGSSEVLESIIGKYKTLQGEHGQFGLTSMSLAIGAFVGRLTQGIIRSALTTVTTKALHQWEQTHLGSTIQSQRKKAFSTAPGGTETGSNQLALTHTN